jgi:hypothetical protein
MASFVYNVAAVGVANGTIDLDTNTLKVMLVKSTYTPANHNDLVVSTNLTANEIAATNYTGGFGGAGRKTATGVTVSQNNSLPGAKVVLSNITWTALGGATNDSIGAAVLIKEGTADTDSLPIVFWDITDTNTNSGDFTLTMDPSAGNIQLTT